MNIQINNINVRYENNEVAGVQVYFTGNNEDRSINISGYIPLTASEYEGNESVPVLTNLVKQKLSERLSPANEA